MTTEQSRPRIGFIGMGSMGSQMAIRLLQMGYVLTIHDRKPEKMQEVLQHGARAANTLRELAIDSDVVMSCVSDNHALSSIMFGPDGAIAGARTGTVFIDLSTVSPEESRKVAEAISQKNAHMLDAAVSGSTPLVREGKLVIFVGGSREIYEQHLPILQQLGQSTFYMGASGMGTTMKMVVNTLLGLGMQAIAEAVILGEKAGLPKEQLIDVLAQTSLIAPAHKAKLQNIKQNEYPAQFSLPLMRKDFSLVMRLATELSVPMPTAAVAEQMYAAALAQGIEEDFSAIFKLVAGLAGLKDQ